MRLRVLGFSIPVLGALAISSLLIVPTLSAQSKLADYKNNLAPYVNSPQHAVEKMLSIANLKPGETLYDLGCGDGRILVAAATQYKG